MKDLVNSIDPEDFIGLCRMGFDRYKPNRLTALATIRNAAGKYYARTDGMAMENALALSYNATRVLVPNLVFSFPKHTISTPYLAARQFAEDLGLALSLQDKELYIDDLYRRVIVDSLHFLGIIKTGMAVGGDLIPTEDEGEGAVEVDAGTIYSERVSPFQFFADPTSREYLFSDARFMGDIIRVPRQVLLDTEGYDHDAVEELSAEDSSPSRAGAEQISEVRAATNKENRLADMVSIAEVYIPSSNVIVTVPGDFRAMNKYLRTSDFYGLKMHSGPYTFLSLTNPVPDNPLPTPFMSVLLDLETKANYMEQKLTDQASRQKDILVATPDAADDAGLLRDTIDGGIIIMSDPNAAQVKSLGGQKQSNEEHLNMLLSQFNLMAANVETLSGVNSAAKSATAANLLSQNASINLADMQNSVYRMAAEEARKRAFYIFNDPLLNQVVARRQINPGQMSMSPAGPQWITPPTTEEVQVTLTPEARKGEFLDLVFSVEPESMARVDAKSRLANAMSFAQQVLPAVAGAAQIMQTLGVPFDAVAFLMRMSKELGITWLDEVVYAPAVQQKAAMEYNQIQRVTGQQAPQTGPPPPPALPNPNLNAAVMQNGQPGQVQGAPPPPQMAQRQGQQAGSEDAQRMVRSVLMRSMTPGKGAPILPNQTA